MPSPVWGTAGSKKNTPRERGVESNQGVSLSPKTFKALAQLGKDLIVLVKIRRLVPSAASRETEQLCAKVAENLFEGHRILSRFSRSKTVQ